MHNDIEPQINTLELILQKQLQLNESLLEMLHKKRDALRDGDTQYMNEVCELEHERVELIKQLESKRQQVVNHITRHIDPQATQPFTLNQIAKHIGGAIGDKLILRRAQVRKAMLDVREEASVTRRATESLMRHMQSIVQTIAAASTGTASYGETGVMNNQGMQFSTLNLTA